MRYTHYNDELGRYTVPCLYKMDGEQVRFYFKTEPEECTHVFGEAIDRLAELENAEEATRRIIHDARLEEMVEVIKPFVSGLACEEESGSCEFVTCQCCRAREIARKIYNAGYRKATADVVEVRHGTWYHGTTESGLLYAECSACGRKMNYTCYGYAYCALCGARMDGKRREE